MSEEITIEIKVNGQSAIRRLKHTDAELEKLRKSGSKSGKAVADAYDEAAESADELAEATGKAGEAGGRLSGVKDEARELADQLRSGDIQGAAGTFGRLAKSAGVAGVALGGAAVAATAVGTALVYGTGKSIEFEQQMLGVAKTTGMTGSGLEGLSSDILDLSGTLGIGRGELAAIAETAGQLGIRGRENIARFTETVAKLASVSDLTAEEAGSLIAQLSNVFDLPIEQAENLGAVMNELSNTTTARAGQIANAMTRAGQAGASLGLSADEVAALSATLIDAGIEAETAGTSLRNVFTRMRTEAARVGEVMGMTAEEVDALIEDDALGAVRAYAEALGEMPPRLQSIEISETFGDENTNAVRALVDQTDMLGTNLSTANEAFEAGTSLNTEFAATLDAVSTQWGMLVNNMQAVAIELTQGILPGLSSALQGINKLFNETNALTTEFGMLNDELGRVQETERLLQQYEEHVANGEEGTREFRETVDALADRLPGYAIKQNDAGEAVGVHAEQMRGLLAAQKAAARAAVMDNLRQQADAYAESLNDLAEAERTQERFRRATNERSTQEVQRLREAYRELEKGSSRAMGFAANRQAAVFGRLEQDADEASQRAGELDAQLKSLARSMMTFYSEMTEAEPGTQAYTDALATLGTELNLTEDEAEALLQQMIALREEQERDPDDGDGDDPDQDDLAATEKAQRGLIDSIAEADEVLSELDESFREATTAPARQQYQALMDQVRALKDEMIEAAQASEEVGSMGLGAVQGAGPVEVPVDVQLPDAEALQGLDGPFVTAKEAADTYEQSLQNLAGSGPQLRAALAAVNAELDQTSDPAAREALQDIRSELENGISAAEAMDRGLANMKAAAEDAAVGGFVALGEAIGNAEGMFESFGEAAKGILSDLAKMLGKTMIKMGVGTMIQNPAKGLALIAAGTALVAIGSSIGSSGSSGSGEQDASEANVPRMNQGGRVTAGQPILVGDGPGGRMTPYTELFVPDEAGTVVPNKQLLTRGMLGAAARTPPPGRATGAMLEELRRTREAFEQKQFVQRGTDIITAQERTTRIQRDAGIK